MSAHHDALDALLVQAQRALDDAVNIPCRGSGDSCLRKAHELRDDDGRPQLWYSSECEAARKLLCPVCLAYWHVAVARNLVLQDAGLRRYVAARAKVAP